MTAAEAAGLPARVGIASSKLAARVAAGLPDPPVSCPTGEEAAFLAPLPLQRLAPEVDVAGTLERWGVRSVGDFARLPPPGWRAAWAAPAASCTPPPAGSIPRPLIPREPPPDFHEGMNLEWPLVALEPFLFVGRAALDRLCRRLEPRGLACLRLELTLRLEPDGHQTRSVDLPAPTRDVKTLLTLVRLELEARPPGAPVAGFTFVAHPDRPREAQLTLYGPAALSPDKLAATLARLFALLGPGRVGSPRPADGHRPERFDLVDFAPPPPPEVRREPRAGRGLLAVRVLRPPVRARSAHRRRDRRTPEAAPAEIALPAVSEDGQAACASKGRSRSPPVPGGSKRSGGPRIPPAATTGTWSSPAAGSTASTANARRGAWYADGVYD